MGIISGARTEHGFQAGKDREMRQEDKHEDERNHDIHDGNEMTRWTTASVTLLHFGRVSKALGAHLTICFNQHYHHT